MPINQHLEQLYLDDIADRKLFDEGRLNESLLHSRDARRQTVLQTLLPKIDENEPWNCHYACLLLMHSGSTDPNVYQRAHSFAKKAIQLGSSVSKWLYAASLDRWLISQTKLQKFGTQFDVKTGKILDYDSSTTDEERSEYGVPPLNQLLQR